VCSWFIWSSRSHSYCYTSACEHHPAKAEGETAPPACQSRAASGCGLYPHAREDVRDVVFASPTPRAVSRWRLPPHSRFGSRMPRREYGVRRHREARPATALWGWTRDPEKNPAPPRNKSGARRGASIKGSESWRRSPVAARMGKRMKRREAPNIRPPFSQTPLTCTTAPNSMPGLTSRLSPTKLTSWPPTTVQHSQPVLRSHHCQQPCGVFLAPLPVKDLAFGGWDCRDRGRSRPAT